MRSGSVKQANTSSRGAASKREITNSFAAGASVFGAVAFMVFSAFIVFNGSLELRRCEAGSLRRQRRVQHPAMAEWIGQHRKARIPEHVLRLDDTLAAGVD